MSEPVTPAPPLRCHDASELAAASEQRAAVVGVYEEVDARQRQVGPTRHAGHAALRLRDETLVALEPMWSEEAIRPLDERQALAGRLVEAIGTVHARTPEPPDPVAFTTGPCVGSIERIEAVDP
jgi:hypothetical protein